MSAGDLSYVLPGLFYPDEFVYAGPGCVRGLQLIFPEADLGDPDGEGSKEQSLLRMRLLRSLTAALQQDVSADWTLGDTEHNLCELYKLETGSYIRRPL